jgi:myo-inositol-1(or 4)-monophosphatase
MNFQKEKTLAKKMALEAGKMLKLNFPKFDRSAGLKYKSKTQIQTWADLAAEKIILSQIKKTFPAHKILSEELGKNSNFSDYYWIIDPLDGTTNYSMHNPLYGVSIALAYKNKIVLGITNMPELGELTVAELGKGVTVNGKPIHVSRQKNAAKSIFTFCHGSMIHDIKRAIKLYGRFKPLGLDFRQMGSSVVEFNFVAMGRTEAIMLPGANLYDVAAGALIVREAGGKVTDFKNNNWNIFSKDILASNGLVHQTVLKTINGN